MAPPEQIRPLVLHSKASNANCASSNKAPPLFIFGLALYFKKPNIFDVSALCVAVVPRSSATSLACRLQAEDFSSGIDADRFGPIARYCEG